MSERKREIQEVRERGGGGGDRLGLEDGRVKMRLILEDEKME